MEKIIFYILAAIMVFFAIASVSSRRMLRSVIYLLFVLVGIAGLYFMIDFAFLAAIQLTVYAGGIIVLMIFSVMLIHHIEMQLDTTSMLRRVLGMVLSLAGLTLVLAAIYSHDFQPAELVRSIKIDDIGRGFLSFEKGGFILPFEVISVLLLAIMIGAIIIAKGNKLKDNK